MPWHEDAFLLLPADGFVLIGVDGTVIFANRFARELLGADRCPSPGDVLAEALPEFAEALAAVDPDASGPVDLVIRVDGRDLGARVFRTDDGGLGIGILASTDDRVGSGPSWVLYDRVLRSINEAVIVTTAEPFDGPGPVIVYVNDAFLRDSGYARHEVMGRSPRIMQMSDTDRAARAHVRAAMDRWSPTVVELENIRKDGSVFWVEIDLAPVADETGWYTHWVSVQSDVTERKRAEEDRASRDAMVRAILDSLPSQSALLDRHGRIVATNQEWHRIWRDYADEPEPDWIGVDYLEVCRQSAATALGGAESAARALDGIRRVLDGALTAFELDYEMRAAGDTLWYHMQVLPLVGGEGAVVTHVDITRRRLAEAELGYRASNDALTGLWNRESLLARIAGCLDTSDRSAFALVLIDLDDFRDVNDAFGHAYGDRLLETVAERLDALAGPQDLVARLGGDEFAFLMREIPPDWDFGAACHRIREALAEAINLDIASVRPSASYGVVMSPPYSGDAQAMLRDAETAMYVSKQAGRDRWTLFADQQRVDVRARAISRERISEALAADEFVLHFQPFVDLASGRTVGSEALLRWDDPVEGLLSPASFLTAIESGPLIEDVGAWVLDHALAVQARWQSIPGYEHHLMSVNVSPRQLGRGRLPALVREMLDRHGIPPSNLGIEVLETSLLTSGESVEDELRQLHDMGVRIAIDDFGTGYSALAYLQTFPIEGVKIDRAFIQRSGTPRGARLLRAAGELARAVGAISIAEGIETSDQLLATQAAGIGWGQGYLLARPAPAAETPQVSSVSV